MNEKRLTIWLCDECPHFDNKYFSFRHRCTKLDRVIDASNENEYPMPDDYPIPDDCPLDDAS